MSTLTLIRGLPGSGKSTLARQLVAQRDSTNPDLEHFEADMFFIKDGVYSYDSNKIGDAHDWCKDNVYRALSVGHSVIVSNTLTRWWEVEGYISATLAERINIVQMKTQFQNIHNVPENIFNRMRGRWQSNEECQKLSEVLYPSTNIQYYDSDAIYATITP